MSEVNSPTPNDPTQAYRRILGFVQKCLHKRSDASPESVAQSIFVSLAGNHEALLRLLAERPDEVMPLILRIARRHIWKHNKRGYRGPDTLSLDAPTGEGVANRGLDPADDATPPEAEVEFLDALGKFEGKLNGEEVKVFRQLTAGHTSAAQIAFQLQLGERTVNRRIERIRHLLLAWLWDLAGDEFIQQLTEEQQQVLRLLIAGHTADQIASQLSVARSRVLEQIDSIRIKPLR